MWVGPALADEVSVPAKEGIWLDEEASPASAGKQPRQPGEQRPVGRAECRPVDLATEDGHLVAEHHDLDRQIVTVTTCKPDQLGDAEKEQVEEAERHDGILAETTAEGPKVQARRPGAVLGTDTPSADQSFRAAYKDNGGDQDGKARQGFRLQ